MQLYNLNFYFYNKTNNCLKSSKISQFIFSKINIKITLPHIIVIYNFLFCLDKISSTFDFLIINDFLIELLFISFFKLTNTLWEVFDKDFEIIEQYFEKPFDNYF